MARHTVTNTPHIPRKINILFAIGRLDVGGAQKLLVHQLATLDAERFTPSLITLFEEQKDSFIRSVRLDECFHFKSTIDCRAFLRLLSFLRIHKFDVVVTSLFTANLVVRCAAILARVPVIVSYEHNIYPDKHRWQIIVDRFLSWWTDRIITDSETARQFTAHQESIPIEKFLTLFIPPLFEQKRKKSPLAVRAELGIGRDALVVLTVSRLVTEKGHRYLIDAAKHILSRFPDVHFLMVGWGSLEQELKDQAEQNSIAGHVTLPGRMDIQDVLPLADIYVDPAVSTDLPVALMEAMREGKAIVATNIGDIPAFIKNEITGLLVEPENIHALVGSIEKLLGDAPLRTRLGEEARKRVQSYSLENYMQSFEQLICDLL